jgi:hypothetical protein
MDIQSIKDRLNALERQEKSSIDATLKSLRAYTTKVHPLCRERLSIHWLDESKSKTTKGRSVEYTNQAKQMRGNTFVHFLLQSFYDQEDSGRGESPILGLKLSMKTILDDSISLNLAEEVTNLWHATRFEEEMIVELRDLVGPFISKCTYNNLVEDYKNSIFSEAVYNFLHRNNFQFPVDDFVQVRGRDETSMDLIMVEKYYPGRDDNRAYCQDRSLIRSITGSCLTRLLYPKDDRTRANLQSASILRPDVKDILDMVIQTTVDDDYATILVIGDVSNFTGSFGNAWLALHCAAHELQMKKKSEQRVLFRINGCLISSTWLEIISMYLYTTVGVPCWAASKQRFQSLPGGFLGVQGNITYSLLMLAAILKQTTLSLKPRVLDIQCQAGGDDFAFAITLKHEEVDSALDSIRNDVNLYIGPLKEFNVYDLTNKNTGIIEEATFCRKKIDMIRTVGTITLESYPTFPLPECLSPHIFLRTRNDQITAWYSLDRTLEDFVKACQRDNKLADSLRVKFLNRYPNVKALRKETIREWNYSESIICIDGRYMSNNAYKVVKAVNYVCEKNRLLFTTVHTKISQALSLSFLITRRLYYKGTIREVLLLPCGEQTLYDVTTSIRQLYFLDYYKL